MDELLAGRRELTADDLAYVFASVALAVVVPIDTVLNCVGVPLEERTACGDGSLSERCKEQCQRSPHNASLLVGTVDERRL